MADIRFGAYSQAFYGDVVQSNTPTSKGLSLVPVNRFSGKPVSQTDVNLYGNNPKDVVYLLYKDGELARGLINNKLYENGKELSKEQIQAGSNVNYAGIAGELATLGLRTPTGTGGSQFIRDAAAEKKFVETVRANLKAGRMPFDGVAGAGIQPVADLKALSAASDADLIAFVGGVNKEGVLGSGYGINASYDPYGGAPLEKLPGGTGYGTGKYGGTGPAQYVRGSRQIVDKDIQELANMSGKLATDKAAAARANQQLLSIFQNDPSWMRKEQARDAMFLLAEAQVNEQGDRVMSFDASGKLTGPDGRPMNTGAQGAGGAGAGAYTASDGRQFSNLDSYTAYQANLDTQKQNRKSAYDLLYEQFNAYGLGALVTPLKGLIEENISPSEFTLRLRDTDAYKKRFGANAQRINKGLRALSEAEYIGLEDQYQDVMRRYGLPENYYTKGDMGRQEGFEKFIGGDVSPVELEDRIQTAQNRVVNAAPEVAKALREFYPDISNGDILAYALDPSKAIEGIKRKVTAAEIGAGAMQAGLSTGLSRAEELQRYGVTKESAQQGFGTIASGLERGRQLSEIYQQPDYNQQVAETEIFALPNAEQARRQRRKLGQLETATFGGTTGMTGGALGRERAGQY